MTKMPQTVVENHSSSLLTSEENAQVFRLSGNRCPTISTTVVQLFETQPPHHSQWFKKHTGVLCFIKDNIRKNYFFRVFNLQRNVMVWEHEMYNNIEYIESTPFLHVFEGEKGIVAFNFASVEEARHMRHTVTHKIQMRKRKEEKRARQSLKLPHESETKQLSHFQQSLKAPSESDARQFNQSLKVSSESDSYVYKKSVTPEATAANRRRKITKDDISIPMDFKHISHVGWNPNSGFDVSSEDEHLKKFLKEAGVSEKQLQDKDTREFIYDFIDKHKVREAMAEVTPPAPLVPPRGPTRTPHARAAPPPPPGPGGGSLSNGPSRPPETPISRKPAPPPAPPMSINTGGSAPPAPPPPPPPPMGMPPPMGGESAPMPPPPPAAPMMDNSALMDSIRNGTSLRPVEERKSAASDDARGDLLSEIRKGHTLRPVNEREIRPSIPSPKNAVAGGNDLATALALALAERSKAIHSDDDDDEGSESSNDDWED